MLLDDRIPPPPSGKPNQVPWGWHTHWAALALGYVVAGLTTLVALVLLLSIFFTFVGIVVLPLAVLAFMSLLKRRKSGAPHPAIFMLLLAIAELLLATGYLRIATTVGADVSAFALGYIPAGMTLPVALALQLATRPHARPSDPMTGIDPV